MSENSSPPLVFSRGMAFLGPVELVDDRDIWGKAHRLVKSRCRLKFLVGLLEKTDNHSLYDNLIQLEQDVLTEAKAAWDKAMDSVICLDDPSVQVWIKALAEDAYRRAVEEVQTVLSECELGDVVTFSTQFNMDSVFPPPPQGTA
jgi:hypothetical protein